MVTLQTSLIIHMNIYMNSIYELMKALITENVNLESAFSMETMRII